MLVYQRTAIVSGHKGMNKLETLLHIESQTSNLLNLPRQVPQSLITAFINRINKTGMAQTRCVGGECPSRRECV